MAPRKKRALIYVIIIAATVLFVLLSFRPTSTPSPSPSPIPAVNPLAHFAVRKGAVLIATPMKQAAEHLDGYFGLVARFDYPASLLSLAVLVSDSPDGTSVLVRDHVARLASSSSSSRYLFFFSRYLFYLRILKVSFFF